ncbi:hypothetical protein [Aquimarina rubra]|uniref:Uncharacterized protein n=1 Tax=Aquimarina rubra TaxID=1920033 RepID=A0ABW5LDZ0_9FLAO
MSKYIIAKTATISIKNYAQGNVFIQMDLPMSYSLLDLIQIIKMYSNYDDTYDWSFINPNEKDKNLSLRNDFEKIDKIRFDEYRNITPAINCIYGPIEMEIGVRGHLKYRKVYPTIYQAVGCFPTEEEFVKNIKIPDIDGKYTILGKSLPSASHLINTDLIEYGEKLKKYFKNKYKISSETIESFFGTENALIKK